MLDLYTGLAISKTECDEIRSPDGEEGFSGSNFSFASEETAVLDLSYSDDERFFARANVIYTGDSFSTLVDLSIAAVLPDNLSGNENRAVLSFFAALFMLVITQLLIAFRPYKKEQTIQPATSNEEDYALAAELKSYLIEQKQFLQTNLKVADVAQALGVSEYRISRVLTHHFAAKNFTQLVNQYRTAHAKSRRRSFVNHYTSARLD